MFFPKINFLLESDYTNFFKRKLLFQIVTKKDYFTSCGRGQQPTGLHEADMMTDTMMQKHTMLSNHLLSSLSDLP